MNNLLLALQAAGAAYALYHALRSDNATDPEHLLVASSAADAAARASALYNRMREQAARTHELTDSEIVELERQANQIFASAAANKSGR